MTINDLSTFFESEQEETSLLEFKSGKVELEVIYKAVCAFLNTEGGILIIGAPVETNSATDKNKRVSIGQLTESKFRNQDTLLSKINSNISPTPVSIKAVSFHYNAGSVFVIEVGQSTTPPANGYSAWAGNIAENNISTAHKKPLLVGYRKLPAQKKVNLSR